MAARSPLVVDLFAGSDQLNRLLPLAGQDHLARRARHTTQRFGKPFAFSTTVLLDSQRQQEGCIVTLTGEYRLVGNLSRLGQFNKELGSRGIRVTRTRANEVTLQYVSAHAIKQARDHHAVSADKAGKHAALIGLTNHRLTRRVTIGQHHQIGYTCGS